MKEKLLELMSKEDLRQGQLADMLEINPAVISHILAGRNKPSFDLLQKILRTFPQINPDWLLLDDDDIYRKNVDTGIPSPTSNTDVAPNCHRSGNAELFDPIPEGSQQPSSNGIKNREDYDSTNVPVDVSTPHKAKIARIVVFYEDQTFENYTPNPHTHRS